jgi:hypothetical protein
VKVQFLPSPPTATKLGRFRSPSFLLYGLAYISFNDGNLLVVISRSGIAIVPSPMLSLNPERKIEDHSALSLAFYLASWGMYRGSSFLLQHDYRIHRAVVDYLLDESTPRALWESSRPQQDPLHPIDFYRDPKHADMLIEACNELWTLFRAKDPKASVTDTLATKILMGTLGCAPAYDQYAVKSIKNMAYMTPKWDVLTPMVSSENLAAIFYI